VTGGFEGTSLLDNVTLGNAYRPPDTMGAVGTTQFLESTNGSYTVYDKYTGAVQQRISFGQFWSNAGQSGQANGDQRILFDQYTNRWISIGFGASVSDINIAVSDTSNAMGSWKSTKFTGFAGGTADYPTLGMDDKGVYIGTNNFTAGGSFAGTSLFSIPKIDLFGGAPSTANMTSFNSPYSTLAGRDNGFAIQGAVNWGGNPTNTASVMAVSLRNSDEVFYKINGVNAAGATKTTPLYIGAQSTSPGADQYNFPNGKGRQPDGTRLVDTLDDRISANVYQANGKLYSVQTVTPFGSTHTAVRWSIVDAATGALLKQGDISGGDYDYYQGSIAVNEFGQVVVGYNRSGYQTEDLNSDGKEDGRISFVVQAFQEIGGDLFSIAGEQLMRVSDMNDYRCGAHNVIDTTCRQRWGDYSAVSIDPTNHHNFFAIGEYAQNWAILPGFTTTERAIWATYIASVAFVPEPSTYALLGIALFGLAVTRRRRMR
jgi:hypothetical protein